MSGAHILPPSWSAGATITANSNESTDLDASNLMRVQPSFFWQSAGLGTLQLTVDTGSSKPWDTVAIPYTNADDGTIRITSHDSTGSLFTTPDFDSDTVGTFNLVFPGDLSWSPDRHVWVAFDTVQTYRYIGVEIVDSNNPDGYFTAGVFVAGVRFTPDIGADIGAVSGYDDPSRSFELMSGETIVRPKRSKAVGRWTFPKQKQSDAMRWREINFAYGSKIPIVFKWDPVDTTSYQQHTIYYGYAQWRSGGAITFANGHGLYDVEFGIREL